MDVNLRIAGEAGQGVQTTGNLLVRSLAGLGLHVYSTQSYMSRIRGGLNWFDIRIGREELFSSRESADVLVALTAQALENLRHQVTPGGLVLFDGPGADGVVGVEFTRAAREVVASAVMANTVAAGAVFSVLGCPLESLLEHLRGQFARKGDETVEKNLACARRGAELAAAQAGKVRAPPASDAPRQVVSGGQAIALGAATAGLKFIAAYPMTPSTAVFTFLAGVADEYGIVVEQAEDEIAAINMALGAAYAGAPAMVTTSGGGFALMVEGVALAGMLELPVLVMVGQRPGPATGLPTRTAQQDLRFVLHAGHGEFPRAVYAPGTLRQAYDLTRVALQTAHKYQSPVFLLTDQYQMDLQKNIPALDRTQRPIDRCILADPPEDYRRYEVTPSGVSPRAIPGGRALVVVDSDEHTEDGHITEDLAARVRQQDKRLAKSAGLLAEAVPPERYGDDRAEHVLVCWGSTHDPCRDAVDILRGQQARVAMVHFAQVWPIDPGAARRAIRGDGIAPSGVTCVEGNATGQFASILRQIGALQECQLMLRYDGMPFTGQEIAARLAR